MFRSKNIAVVLALWALACPCVRADDDIDKKAVERAQDFLKAAERGKFIGAFCHFGLRYEGHSHVKTTKVKNASGTIPGHFALVYDLKMSNRVETQLAFYCGTKGNIYRAQVLDSTGVINSPYALADLSIKVLGEAVYEALKKDLKEGSSATSWTARTPPD
jgi:hypothetical protein